MEYYGLDVERHFRQANTNPQTKETIMEPVLTFNSFVRRPFLVAAVQITADNIDQLAGMLGEVKEKEDGEKHILLDRRIVPNIKRAFIGWWVTKLDDNLRCYSPKVFEREFEVQDGAWETYFSSIADAAERFLQVEADQPELLVSV